MVTVKTFDFYKIHRVLGLNDKNLDIENHRAIDCTVVKGFVCRQTHNFNGYILGKTQ